MEDLPVAIGVRARPLRAAQESLKCCLAAESGQDRILVRTGKQNAVARADAFFDARCPHATVFDSMVQPLLISAVLGHDSVLIMYGTPDSGVSALSGFSALAGVKFQPTDGTSAPAQLAAGSSAGGLLTMALSWLFQQQRVASDMRISCQLCEITSSHARDLFRKRERGVQLPIHDSAAGASTVIECPHTSGRTARRTTVLLKDLQMAVSLLDIALSARDTRGVFGGNEASQASAQTHMELSLIIDTKDPRDARGRSCGKFSIVQLVGQAAESVCTVAYQRTLKDIQALCSICSVLNSAPRGSTQQDLASKLVYRQSSLASHLQDVLRVENRNALLFCVSPLERNAQSTTATLQLASSALGDRSFHLKTTRTRAAEAAARPCACRLHASLGPQEWCRFCHLALPPPPEMSPLDTPPGPRRATHDAARLDNNAKSSQPGAHAAGTTNKRSQPSSSLQTAASMASGVSAATTTATARTAQPCGAALARQRQLDQVALLVGQSGALDEADGADGYHDAAPQHVTPRDHDEAGPLEMRATVSSCSSTYSEFDELQLAHTMDASKHARTVDVGGLKNGRDSSDTHNSNALSSGNAAPGARTWHGSTKKDASHAVPRSFWRSNKGREQATLRTKTRASVDSIGEHDQSASSEAVKGLAVHGSARPPAGPQAFDRLTDLKAQPSVRGDVLFTDERLELFPAARRPTHNRVNSSSTSPRLPPLLEDQDAASAVSAARAPAAVPMTPRSRSAVGRADDAVQSGASTGKASSVLTGSSALSDKAGKLVSQRASMFPSATAKRGFVSQMGAMIGSRGSSDFPRSLLDSLMFDMHGDAINAGPTIMPNDYLNQERTSLNCSAQGLVQRAPSEILMHDLANTEDMTLGAQSNSWDTGDDARQRLVSETGSTSMKKPPDSSDMIRELKSLKQALTVLKTEVSVQHKQEQLSEQLSEPADAATSRGQQAAQLPVATSAYRQQHRALHDRAVLDTEAMARSQWKPFAPDNTAGQAAASVSGEPSTSKAAASAQVSPAAAPVQTPRAAAPGQLQPAQKQAYATPAQSGQHRKKGRHKRGFLQRLFA